MIISGSIWGCSQFKVKVLGLNDGFVEFETLTKSGGLAEWGGGLPINVFRSQFKPLLHTVK